MSRMNRIQHVYESAKQLQLTEESKFVIFSDCHRGTGDSVDKFAKNQNLYCVALQHYFERGFTYIEIGDGDELWLNTKFSDIKATYEKLFSKLAKFYEQGRLYFIWGNHDIVKKREKWVRQNLDSFTDPQTGRAAPLFPGVKPLEGLALKGKAGEKILLLHGHQADFLNDTLWPISKFLVRHVWRPLASIGIKDPTSASLNFNKKDLIEKRLAAWSEREGVMMIAGHTHRAVFPKMNEPPYFNDGCCVNPRQITALEIEDENITLVGWSVQARRDGGLFIKRNVLDGPDKITDFFRPKRPA